MAKKTEIQSFLNKELKQRADTYGFSVLPEQASIVAKDIARVKLNYATEKFKRTPSRP